VSLGCGKTLTMVNDSHWVHIIGPGRDADSLGRARCARWTDASDGND